MLLLHRQWQADHVRNQRHVADLRLAGHRSGTALTPAPALTPTPASSQPVGERRDRASPTLPPGAVRSAAAPSRAARSAARRSGEQQDLARRAPALEQLVRPPRLGQRQRSRRSGRRARRPRPRPGRRPRARAAPRSSRRSGAASGGSGTGSPVHAEVSGETGSTGPEALPKVTIIPRGRSRSRPRAKVARPTPS